MRNLKVLRSLQVCVLSCLTLGAVTLVHADTPFIGEVRWFAGNFAPRGWALCEGQILPISQNDALFSLLGTTYGGDGRTTFGLPDLRGRGMVHEGTGPGLTPRPLGSKAGTETVVLNQDQLPAHSHALGADGSGGDSVLPESRVLSSAGRLQAYEAVAATADMGVSAIDPAGGAQSHNNMQPNIALKCIIAMQGVYPSRN